MQSVVITGASTGIGWATAKLLLGSRISRVRQRAQAGRRRPPEGANSAPISPRCCSTSPTRPRCWPPPARSAPRSMAKRSTGLVNNAGIAVAGPVLELAADEFRRQMDVNVIGPIIATQAFGPLLGSDPSLKGPKGRIVMISLGGRQERQSADGGLFGVEARDRGAVGKPAPRNDAVRHRRHHRRARRGEDADLEQGRGGRHFRLPEFAVSSGAGKGPRLHAASRARSGCRRRRSPRRSPTP